jgi:SHS2 domain-containing protein
MSLERPYETLPHTADLAVRVRGGDPAALFANAAFALSDNLVDLETVRPRAVKTIEIEAAGLEDLLVRWLNEILFVFERDAFIGREFEPRISEPREPGPWRLEAAVRGETVDPARHRLYSEIKAVTYHGLVVAREAGAWRAEMVFDL